MLSARRHVTAVLVSVALAAGCARYDLERPMHLAPDDWTAEGGGPARWNAAEGQALAFPLTPAWTYSTHANVLAQPMVRDSLLFVPTTQGELLILSATTGDVVGKVSYSSPPMASPVLAEGLLFLSFASGKESLLAADFRTGKVRWSAAVGPIEAAPLLVDGRLCVATLSGAVLSVDPSTGAERWKSAPPEDRRKTIRSSPAADSAKLFVAAIDGTVTAYRLSDGGTEWTVKTGGGIFAGLLVVGDEVIAANTSGEVLCLDAGTGTARWRVPAGGSIYAAPASNGDCVFVGSSDGTVSSFDAATGARRWTYHARSNVSASPLVCGPTVFIGSFDRSLTAVTADSGHEVWRWVAEGRLRVSPVAWRGHLFVVTDDREITAFRQRQP